MRRAAILALVLAACARPRSEPSASAAANASSAIAASSTADLAGPAAIRDVASAEDRPSRSDFDAIDDVVAASIVGGEVPGAVVEVVLHGEIVFAKAYGNRAVEPAIEPMTLDSIFDLASLTKPLATALSIHLLAERKRLRLQDLASRFLPELAGTDLASATIEELLLHTAGLPADDPLADYDAGLDEAVKRIARTKLPRAPGSGFEYSDVGYVLLGAIVTRAGGASLDRFFAENIAAPLALESAGFHLDAKLAGRAVPTERDVPRGVVHDPRARRLGGVAGHAGLFATAGDVAKIARMILGGGELDGARVFARDTIARLEQPHDLPGDPPSRRALGFDVDTKYSGNRGALGGGFGHTGFTGTSLWIAPAQDVAVIVLASRLHPNGKGDATKLRRAVADVVARAIVKASSTVRTGIDVLEDEKFARLRGRHVGLVTHASGVDASGARDVDVMRAAGVDVIALFAPEHGLASDVEGAGAIAKDGATGLPVHALYGAGRGAPRDDELAGIDTIVVDLQDAGARFYTYETTLGLVLEAARRRSIRVVVLDRSNPLGGDVEGPLLDAGAEAFIAYHRIPIRHGMTMGELARLFVQERSPGVDLDVVAMKGWVRDRRYGATGLRWIAPSPNLKTATQALLYPGVALVEATNVSVGRGTDTPFEVIGAPWIDGAALARALTSANLDGVRVEADDFTPSAGPFAGERCHGVRFVVTDADKIAPVSLGVALARALVAGYPNDFQTKNLGLLIGNAKTTAAILRGDSIASIVASWRADEEAFRRRRAEHLLYR